MFRLFDLHHHRWFQELEGLWDFAVATGPEASAPEIYTHRLPVPGCWEQHPDFLTYRGTGWYRTTLRLPADGHVRLDFLGVSHTADVYFNGQHVGHHYNAFTPFTCIVPHQKAGLHTLTIRVDNRFTEASSLHIPNDYYTYGGLIRPVAVSLIPDISIDRVALVPSEEHGIWKVNATVKLRCVAPSPLPLTLSLALAGGTALWQIPAGSSDTVFTTCLTTPDARPWTPSTPELFMAEVRLSSGDILLDDLRERTGFRTVRVSGRQLLVNETPVFLKGFNRHEDFGIVGCAIPLQLMVKDLDLMRRTGANTVRTCHYPNDPRFLDLCDEAGMFVWEENHARGLKLHHMENPNFDRQCADCNREMVEAHINHPGIIIWGILNECAGETETGRMKYKMQLDQLRLLDNSRPLTTATCHHLRELTMDLVDIVSLNIYSGWYTDDPVAGFYEEVLRYCDSRSGTEKPVILSEFGGAGIYGYRDPARVRWSEERQSDILDESLTYYMSRPEIVGTLIWQFADCRVTEENGWWQTRARTHNNKGIVDDYRRPKLCFDTVTRHFTHGSR